MHESHLKLVQNHLKILFFLDMTIIFNQTKVL